MYLGRDSGWIQLDTFSPQEAYDLGLCAFKIGEDHDVRLPVMVHQDGFLSSHTAQGVKTIADDVAYDFVGEFKPMNAMLDFEHPATHGVQTEEDWHFEHKARQQYDLMTKVYPKTKEVFAEFKELTGREYKMVETYDADDADVVITALGTTVETARVAAKQLREEGIKAGVVAIRMIRPFPMEDVREAFKGVKAIATLDRSSPHGTVGMLYNEVAGAMYQMKDNERPLVSNYIYGLGGRDITVKHLKDIFSELIANVEAGSVTTPLQQYVNVRGPKLSFL